MRFVDAKPGSYSGNLKRGIATLQDHAIAISFEPTAIINEGRGIAAIQDLAGIESRPDGVLNEEIIGAKRISMDGTGLISALPQSGLFWRYYNARDSELQKHGHLGLGEDSLTATKDGEILRINAHHAVLNPTGVATLLYIEDGRNIVATTKLRRKADYWKTGIDLVSGYSKETDKGHIRTAARETAEETGQKISLRDIELRGFVANNSIGHAHTSILAVASAPYVRRSDLVVGDECDLVVLPNTWETISKLIEFLGKTSQPYMAGAILLMARELDKAKTSDTFVRVYRHFDELKETAGNQAFLADQRKAITQYVGDHIITR